ncbi:hypothetical protein ACJIZ3_012876 [Penstemon smallii]|uniref:Uncharacterized protein n=1 Tax=Penstemon smallii TaxID=265156 RepID=A0ABD3UNA7_9LAMI
MKALVQPLRAYKPVEPKTLGLILNQESFLLHHSRSILHSEFPTSILQLKCL